MSLTNSDFALFGHQKTELIEGGFPFGKSRGRGRVYPEKAVETGLHRTTGLRPFGNITPAVQFDALFVSPLPRPVLFQRHIGNFQQLPDLSMASIQTARSITQTQPSLTLVPELLKHTSIG